VATRASFVESRRGFVISASGGVLIHSWEVADRKETSQELATVRQGLADGTSSAHWRWN
jgi:hypothetical protein